MERLPQNPQKKRKNAQVLQPDALRYTVHLLAIACWYNQVVVQEPPSHLGAASKHPSAGSPIKHTGLIAIGPASMSQLLNSSETFPSDQTHLLKEGQPLPQTTIALVTLPLHPTWDVSSNTDVQTLGSSLPRWGHVPCRIKQSHRISYCYMARSCPNIAHENGLLHAFEPRLPCCAGIQGVHMAQVNTSVRRLQVVQCPQHTHICSSLSEHTMGVIPARDVRRQAPIAGDVILTGGQVFSHGELQTAAITQGEEALHHSFAKSALPIYHGAIIVMQGPCSG